MTLVKQKHKEKKEKREKCTKLTDRRKIVPVVFIFLICKQNYSSTFSVLKEKVDG